MSPEEYCENKTFKSGSSFYYSFLTLKNEKKNAIMALYAFCREVDDIADSGISKEIANTKIMWWKKEIYNLFNYRPVHPITISLKPQIEKFNLEEVFFNQIIDGMLMDLNFSTKKNFKELEKYCFNVASTVGILSANIFGITDSKTLKFAEKLGIALQLTNIIRDVGEDAIKGRIYLPEDEMDMFNISKKEIFALKVNKNNFVNLMDHQYSRAMKYYDIAFSLLPKCDLKNQKPGIIMAEIYQKLLKKIKRKNYNVLSKRITLVPLTKLWIAYKYWLR